MLLLSFISSFVFTAAFGAFDNEPTPPPFFKAPKVYKTMTTERALPVSAKIDKIKTNDGEKERLHVVAAGHVSVPLSYAWKKVQEFDRLPKVSSHFNKAEYYPDQKRLLLVLTALGYQAIMYLELKFEEKPKWKEIQWKSVEGAFVGMSGVVRLEDYELKKTEISLVSNHETKKLPLPDAIKGFVIEVISQRVAGLMREHIESEFKKEKKK